MLYKTILRVLSHYIWSQNTEKEIVNSVWLPVWMKIVESFPNLEFFILWLVV